MADIIGWQNTFNSLFIQVTKKGERLCKTTFLIGYMSVSMFILVFVLYFLSFHFYSFSFILHTYLKKQKYIFVEAYMNSYMYGDVEKLLAQLISGLELLNPPITNLQNHFFLSCGEEGLFSTLQSLSPQMQHYKSNVTLSLFLWQMFI